MIIEDDAESLLMTYKLDSKLRLIKTSVILEVDGIEKSYENSEELTRLEFEKKYMVDSVSARGNIDMVTLKDNERQFNINWIGEKEVCFI